MAKFKEIYGELKTVEEKDKFIEAQHATINQLTEQIRDLEAKNKHLEQLVASAVPIIGGSQQASGNYSSEEELIAREQLKMFALLAAEREFTMEEARKVDIYAKLLMSLRSQDKKNLSQDLSKVPPAQLLKLIEEDNG